jgi:hypothetical protein
VSSVWVDYLEKKSAFSVFTKDQSAFGNLLAQRSFDWWARMTEEILPPKKEPRMRIRQILLLQFDSNAHFFGGTLIVGERYMHVLVAGGTRFID